MALSTVSLWETMVSLQKGRVASTLPPNESVRAWKDRVPFEWIPLGEEEAVLSRTLPFAHEDPGDRFIVATAVARGLPLMTADAKLLALDWLPTIRV